MVNDSPRRRASVVCVAGGGRRTACILGALAGLAALPGTHALAGGTAENALLLIDPSSVDSMYIGNYYRNARNIPDANVLYLDPDAPNYTAFRATQLVGFLGELDQRRTLDHIDYVVVTPGNSFYVSAPGLVTDGCSPVTRFAMSSAYAMAYIVDDVLAGPTQGLPNRYYSTTTTLPRGFESSISWLNGNPSTDATARRYFIGALLGYINPSGNSVQEIVAMIDRSVGADGTRPAGTFYFMNNTGDSARNVRANQYAAATSALTGLGAASEVIIGTLPIGRQDVLGCITGFANDNIDAQNMTLIPGCFADHLTSYAATLDNASQTKLSQWIRKGASGSAGTVEEPCNYPGKFVNARLHPFFFQGMSLGEAYLRTSQFVPFQSLLYGDPLTRTFAYIPVVNLAGVPTQPASGLITLTPSATTQRPSTLIARHELLIDGVLAGTVNNGGQFTVNTARLNDGWHDVRALSYDNTVTKTVGRLVTGFVTNNFGHAAGMTATTTIGTLTTNYQFNVSAGADAGEVRLLLNGRVVGSRTGSGAIFVKGQCLGAGQISPQAEVTYNDGRKARSAPVSVTVLYNPGVPTTQAPVAFDYTKTVANNAPFVLELPASFDTDPSGATYTVVTAPSQATISSGSKAFRVVTPTGTPCGTDTVVFNVTTSEGTSANATITIEYAKPFDPCPSDFDDDGFVTGLDYDLFVIDFEAGNPAADFDNDCFVTGRDFDLFVADYEIGC